ncbi:hypothetical protein BG015_001235 [Linnemannia schmuckeri]|uniref:EF-hand domain-containing protein n=1 Tax=Linnemannia schmuckeri TaxID=64567 RepID=A0A9P5RQ88_9FUNG|nr:hypothetical protein BG015_001235 [Linnemannia schmuckeri]
MSKSRAGTVTNKKTSEGVSDAYYNELVATFQLHSAKETDTLSLHSLQRAMRTLGFDATIDDLLEIVNGTPTLSMHKGKNKKKTRKSKGKGTTATTSQARTSSRRSLSRRASQKSKYVDSDEGEPSGDDDDDQDVYQGEEDEEDEDEYGVESDEYYFTFQDFVSLMKPSEEEHAQDEISRVFQLFDTQGKGSIRLEDLRRIASELGIPMKEQELQEMIEEGDRDGDGGVTEQEFARIMKKAGF